MFCDHDRGHSCSKIVPVSFVTVFTILCVCISFPRVVHSVIYPRIEIQGWVTNFEDESSEVGEESPGGYRGGHSWSWETKNLTHLLTSGLLAVTRQDEYLTYIVSQHLERLRITCTAPYPVSWVAPVDPFHPDSMYSYVFGVFDRRIAKNVRDPSTFTYVSTLEIYDSSGQATRNYTCQSLAPTNSGQGIIKRSLYVYWEGNTYLVYAGDILDIKTQNEETVVLPCKVSRPDVSVFLFKETPNGYEELVQNSSITFHPITGFTLRLNELADPYGRYECISEDDSDSDEEDSVKLNVLRGLHKPPIERASFNQTIQGNATLKYDPAREQIHCCSSSGKAPNLRIMYCRNELACRQKEHLLYKIGSRVPKWGVNGSCTTFDVYPRESGILRCRGDGIDVFHEYFTGHKSLDNATFLTYFKRGDAKPEDLMMITSSFQDYRLYDGQNFTTFCDASDYYFIKGIQWAVIWKNNSIQFLDERSYNPTYNNETKDEPYEEFDTAQVLAQYDMYSIVCYAPVWNSTNAWVKKELVLDVQESILPELKMVESATWTLNDTNRQLVCEVNGGAPKPFIKWRKNNKTLINDDNISMSRFNNTFILKFHFVSYSTQGNYSCIAINYAGRVIKSTIVSVQQGSGGSSTHSRSDFAGSFFTFFITAIMTGLLIGVGILIWRLNLQKRIITHLTSVVFRDVDNGRPGAAGAGGGGGSSGGLGGEPTSSIQIGSIPTLQTQTQTLHAVSNNNSARHAHAPVHAARQT